MAKPEVFYSNKEITGVSLKPKGLDKETISSIVQNLTSNPRAVVLRFEFINHRAGETQNEIREFETGFFKSLRTEEPSKKASIMSGLEKTFSIASEAIIISTKPFPLEGFCE